MCEDDLRVTACREQLPALLCSPAHRRKLCMQHRLYLCSNILCLSECLLLWRVGRCSCLLMHAIVPGPVLGPDYHTHQLSRACIAASTSQSLLCIQITVLHAAAMEPPYQYFFHGFLRRVSLDSSHDTAKHCHTLRKVQEPERPSLKAHHFCGLHFQAAVPLVCVPLEALLSKW